jgi:hypothetical protein
MVGHVNGANGQRSAGRDIAMHGEFVDADGVRVAWEKVRCLTGLPAQDAMLRMRVSWTDQDGIHAECSTGIELDVPGIEQIVRAHRLRILNELA